MRALAIVLALGGCAANGDPCAGAKGVCIGLRVEGAVSGLDQLAFSIDVPNTTVQLTPDPPRAFNLPVRVALFPPAGTSGTVHVSCDGTGGAALLGHGEVDAPLVSGHAEETLTLLATSSADMPSVDLAGADFTASGGDGPMPDLIACAGVTSCMDGDGCCPADCNNTNDHDCAPVCGNHVVETGEVCDDGNTNNGDACDPTCQWANILTTLSGVAGATGYADGTMEFIGSSPTATRFSGPAGLASDGSTLYILDGPTIRTMSVSGGQVTTLFGPNYPVVGPGDGPFSGAHVLSGAAGGLAYLSSNQKLYFSDITSFSTDTYALREVDLAAQTVTTIPSTVVSGQPRALAADATFLYFRNNTGDLEKWKPGDPAPSPIATANAIQASSGVSCSDNNGGIARSSGKTFITCYQSIVSVTDAGGATSYAGNTNVGIGCTDAAHKADAVFNVWPLLGADDQGNLFAADCDAVREIAPADGGVSTVAGQLGVSGYQDGPTNTSLFSVGGNGGPLWWHNISELLVGDNATIRRAPLQVGAGDVATLAGSSPAVHAIDERGSASASRFNNITDVISDGTNLYALGSAAGAPAMSPQPMLIKVDLTTGTSSDVHPLSASGNAFTRIGSTLYVALSDGSIRSMGTDGSNDTVFAGMGGGTTSPPSDGTPGNLRSAVLNPRSITNDGTDLYFADIGGLIRKITLSTSTVSLIAGGAPPGSPPNNAISDGVGSNANFVYPSGLTYLEGNLYTMDGLFPCCMGAVRRINLTTREVKSIVGRVDASPPMGTLGDSDGIGVAGQIAGAQYLTNDGRSLFITDSNFLVSFMGSSLLAPTIRQVDLTNLSLTTMIGTRGLQTIQNGTGTQALVNNPEDNTSTMPMLRLSATRMYLADNQNAVIRAYASTNDSIVTIAGSSPAVNVNDVRGSAADSRYTTAADIVSDGTKLYALGHAAGSSGTPRTLVSIDLSSGASTDLFTFGADGRAITRIGSTLYVALADGSVRSIGSDGSGDALLAGLGGGATYPPADGAAASAVLDPTALTTDGTDLYFVDNAKLIRKISLGTKMVGPVVGTQASTDVIDASGAGAHFANPSGLVFAGGALYTLDATTKDGATIVRRVTLTSKQVNTIAGATNSIGDADGMGTAGQIAGAHYLASDGTSLFISDASEPNLTAPGQLSPTVRQLDLASLSLTTMVGKRGTWTIVNGVGTNAIIHSPGPITFDTTTQALYFFDLHEGVFQRVR